MRLTVALAVLALAGCAEPSVTRIVDGRPEEGRFISSVAYAYYARGAAAEIANDLTSAVTAFTLAAAEDPESPEIWTRLGALYCLVELPSGARAEQAFARVVALDPHHGPLYRERARCRSARGDQAGALVDADRALALDPDDLDTALVRALVLDRLGHAEDARRALRALTLRHPGSTEPWVALQDLGARAGDAGLVRESAEHLAGLRSAHDGAPQAAPLATVDEALLAGDLAAAQHRALRQRMPDAEVALRAAALGLAALAREQAEVVLGADPGDASARIALVAAADLRGDVPALAALMAALPRHSTAPSPLARWLFAEVLRRRVSAEAARAWLGEGAAAGGGGGDALLAATEKRVRAALVGP